MDNSVILDNWTFRDVGSLFANGYNHDRVLMLEATGTGHEYPGIVDGELQLQALMQLLTQVVLRDTLRLERTFQDSWEAYDEIFRPISDARLVLLTTPILEGKAIRVRTAQIVQELCVTDSLRQMQQENEASFAQHKGTVHGFESQVMWGSAGMLSRSDEYRTPYFGHPLRQRFIESTKAWRPSRDIHSEVLDIVNAKKANIYTSLNETGNTHRAILMLPAIAAEVITKAQRPEDLFPVALELRDKYRKLRGWLGEMRIALAEENTAKLAAYKKTMKGLERDMSSLTGDSGGSEWDLTISWPPSFSLKGAVDLVQRRFTIRHELMKLVKTPAGQLADQKLRSMFNGGIG